LTHTTTVGLTVSASAPAPNFSLSATPYTLTQGGNGTSTITVTPQNGFSGSVMLSVSGLPSGVTASAFNPASTMSTSVLTLTASSTAATGTYSATITGTSGTLTHTAMLNLTVNASAPAPNFSLSATPYTLTQGGNGTSTITVTPQYGFSGSVMLSVSGLPSGVTASAFNPASTMSTSVLTLTASSTAATGTYSATITGTSGSLSHTAMLNLTVNASAPAPNFSLSATPYTLTQGGNGTSTITVTGQNGFTGSVALSVSGLPSGVTASAFNPANTTSTSVLTLTASSTAATGTYSATITGTSGMLTHTAMLNLTINSASSTSSLVVSPSSLTFNYYMGGSWPSPRTLAVTSIGGATSYTAKETDPWLSITPTSGATPGSIRASVNPTGMAAGSYGAQINITGQNGKTTTVMVALIITSAGGRCDDGCGGTPGGMYAQAYMSDTQSGTLAAAWVNNMGASPLSTIDPLNRGLVLAMSASASTSTWAGAVIQNVTGMSLTELGFDFRASIPCSSDSAYFMVVTTDGVKHSVGGCTSSPTTPPSSAPAGWMRLRFDPKQATPAINSPVQSISIELNKGSVTTGSIAVIDNIEINGMPVGKGATWTSTSRDN
jgi:uncharacterized protein with FMN-binding domain